MLFFDLDGPLLDVSPRYVALHDALLGPAALAGPIYWERKRAACPEETILGDLGIRDPAPLIQRRLERIETPEYLALDRVWPWTRATLTRLESAGPFVMVTARACRPLLLEQLDRLGLSTFFEEILSTPAGRRVDEQKAELIRDYLTQHRLEPAGHWMIGDTEADVGAGRLVGLRTVAVLSGIRNRELLLRANPNYLLDDIRELPLIVEAPSHSP